jgi:hypothetical protein
MGRCNLGSAEGEHIGVDLREKGTPGGHDVAPAPIGVSDPLAGGGSARGRPRSLRRQISLSKTLCDIGYPSSSDGIDSKSLLSRHTKRVAVVTGR